MHTEGGWNDFFYFLQVATHGSIKGAAKAMGVDYSTVFRRINSLEERLQVRLFDRLKTGYTLTQAGGDILSRVQQVDSKMDEIRMLIQGKDVNLSGTIKVSTTDTIGYYWLPPYLARFKELYPDIMIDLDVRTGITNMSKREADIVMPAINRQPDYMVGKTLAPINVHLYGSKGYIARFGIPTGVADFNQHRFLMPNEALQNLPSNKWLRSYVQEENMAASCDKLTGLYRLAKQGLGLTVIPHYIAEGDPEMIRVMELPPECSHQIWILTHPDLRFVARIRTFMQFMYEATAAIAAS